ncbi:hypothetical protein X943_002292 [Babesia divergens]|uniref:Uncharacterized protein n=1 Tax=Babesia divergens TaxID=32595 RepID=A0AAD9GII9_BABDI|nr:hypothetical protein X943_002292 [Babesia divergens]
MEVGTDVESVKLNQDDITEIGYYKDPNVKEGVNKGETNVPNEIVNDSQECLEGRTLDDKAELVKEVFA